MTDPLDFQRSVSRDLFIRADFKFRKQYRFGKDPQIVINFHVETVTKVLTIKVNGITKYQNSQGNLSYKWNDLFFLISIGVTH